MCCVHVYVFWNLYSSRERNGREAFPYPPVLNYTSSLSIPLPCCTSFHITHYLPLGFICLIPHQCFPQYDDLHDLLTIVCPVPRVVYAGAWSIAHTQYLLML